MPTADKAAQAGPGQIFKWDKPSALVRAAQRRANNIPLITPRTGPSTPTTPGTPATPTTPSTPSTPTGAKKDRRRCAAYPRLSSAMDDEVGVQVLRSARVAVMTRERVACQSLARSHEPIYPRPCSSVLISSTLVHQQHLSSSALPSMMSGRQRRLNSTSSTYSYASSTFSFSSFDSMSSAGGSSGPSGSNGASGSGPVKEGSVRSVRSMKTRSPAKPATRLPPRRAFSVTTADDSDAPLSPRGLRSGAGAELPRCSAYPDKNALSE
ncbi:hypothetical protein A1Q2_00953 [Trichosporon asahii var. asahii CBS 8904]|uniref:Uncharacterized protein n=1 Tax=Trichosporon asahii var. asahii (strain CBS 8904) TaxID=1220162 RepID=K1W769_TRIAC|nr:hypothetical protein A1Q2_00953 [Trichosporon asahii var. asahii CBS 8904]